MMKDSGQVYVASSRLIRSTPRKVGMVASVIRGLDASKAVNELRFSSRKAAADMLAVLRSAIHNAEHNFNVNVDDLYVSEVLVGKSITMKRFMARARGRGMRILKRSSNLVVKLKSREEN